MRKYNFIKRTLKIRENLKKLSKTKAIKNKYNKAMICNQFKKETQRKRDILLVSNLEIRAIKLILEFCLKSSLNLLSFVNKLLKKYKKIFRLNRTETKN